MRVVLVVDDDPLVLELTTMMLEELGCDAIPVTSPFEALEKLQTDLRIEILITDINMPEMDGHKLAHRAREVKPELGIVMLSGRGEGQGLPMLRKPFSQDDLARAIAQTTGLC